MRAVAVRVLCVVMALGCSDGAKPSSMVEPGTNGGAPSMPVGGSGGSGKAAGPSGGALSLGGDTGEGEDRTPSQIISGFRIEPIDAVLTTRPGESVTQSYQAFATYEGSQREYDVTERTVFYVPDNFLVGGFPLDGSATFASRLPMADGDPPQRGGTLTVQAQAASADGGISTITTSLTVKLVGGVLPAAGSPQATPALPAAPEDAFSGSPSPAQAPKLFYPNDGTVLPPNLGSLEVHFQPGSGSNSLFEVAFTGPMSELRFYARCAADAAAFEPGSCNLALDREQYGYVAESNRGLGPVTLTVRGADEQGAFGEAAPISLEFAENRVDGATYYWAASSPPRIMRVAFDAGAVPEAFLAPGDFTNDGGQVNGTCVGCHVLSRDGSKLAASIGNSSDGRLAYVRDLSVARSDTWLTVNPASSAGPGDENRILTGAFNPDGTRWVATAPRSDAATDAMLFFHDGTTGLRVAELPLPFTPAAPDWSPDGSKIAMTHIYGSNATTVEFAEGGIDFVEAAGNGWSEPKALVAHTPGKNRFNPSFLPGSKYLLFSESQGSGSSADGYSDPSTKTWVVAVGDSPTPIQLARASAAGVADLADTGSRGLKDGVLMDTFPRATPFEIEHRGGTLLWFTVSSQRRAGLRKVFLNNSAVGDAPTQQLIWMFALDPAELEQNLDGSRPGFFLPFQDMKSSNHMAQWTEKVVSDQPQPPIPTPTIPDPPIPPSIK